MILLYYVGCCVTFSFLYNLIIFLLESSLPREIILSKFYQKEFHGLHRTIFLYSLGVSGLFYCIRLRPFYPICYSGTPSQTLPHILFSSLLPWPTGAIRKGFAKAVIADG